MNAMPEITTGTFATQVLESALPVLVDFGADWCPPCKALEPILREVAQRYQGRLAVVSVDVDAEPALMQRYGVMGLPTLILFAGGEPVERIVGFQPRERLEARLRPHLGG